MLWYVIYNDSFLRLNDILFEFIIMFKIPLRIRLITFPNCWNNTCKENFMQMYFNPREREEPLSKSRM